MGKTALELELAKALGLKIAGGSVDIYKCFDQLNRSLIYALAKEAGMPMRVLNPDKYAVHRSHGGSLPSGPHHWQPTPRPFLPSTGLPFLHEHGCSLDQAMDERDARPECKTKVPSGRPAHRRNWPYQARYINAMGQSRVFSKTLEQRSPTINASALQATM